MKSVVLTFGRMNPPTAGHEKLVKKVSDTAKRNKADARIYLSQSQDPKKNPLSYKDKVKVAKLLFPKYAGIIEYDTGVRSFVDAMIKAERDGYDTVYFVVGGDRVAEFKNRLNSLNGKTYNMEKIEVVSAGERDPDAEGVTGISASKMRKFASEDDFDSFKKGLPRGTSPNVAKKAYDAVRKGMS